MKFLFSYNIKTKLIASFLTIIIVSGLGSIFIGVNIIQNSILRQAHEQVKKHLDTASYIYDQDIVQISCALKREANSRRIIYPLLYNRKNELRQQVDEMKGEFNLDILYIVDTSGRIITGSTGFPLLELPSLRYVLENNKPFRGTEIIPQHILLAEGKKTAERSHISVVSTPRQRKEEKKKEDRALAQVAAYPVFKGKRLIGVLYGARIMNNSTDLVDRIKKLIFHDEKIGPYELGTVTIFLDDVRISTNVRNEDGSRTVGTRVSEEVYHQVVENKNTWLHKAFVVNTWYISAYQPIYNISREVIGILYVGVLEEKYKMLKRQSMEYFLLLMIVAGILSVGLAGYLIGNIVGPIRDLVKAASRVTAGNLQSRVKKEYGGEIGQLIRIYNSMIDAIEERDKQLKETAEKQIFQSEKLASLGRLASGVAHEINNPLTGILTYGSMLMDELKETEYHDDLKTIVDETVRCRNIVRELLDFARETQLQIQETSLNSIISESLNLLGRTYKFQNIEIEKNLEADLPSVMADVNQMKSVVSNLAVNAADAMGEGGHLLVSTMYEREKERVVMEVTDNGSGISDTDLEKIFDPFFTTKATGEGTGLGLAVTYGIIERHGGHIRVMSEVGKGTTFIIELPIK